MSLPPFTLNADVGLFDRPWPILDYYLGAAPVHSCNLSEVSQYRCDRCASGERTSLFVLRVSPWQIQFAIGGKRTGAGRDR